MEDNELKNDFCPREYQIDLFERALNENVIIYLPTGCGKTYIASMLLKHLSEGFGKKYSEEGKRSFFLVCTVTLAHQQSEAIKKVLPFSVGTYTGDMGVDYWKEERWINEMDTYQVLVMTAQIFLDMLRHRYISLSQVNLIIMDECHHAVKQHAMKQIMELYHEVPLNRRPRVIGLTATLLNSNIKINEIENEIHDLEVTMHAKICRAKNEAMIKSFAANPKEEIILYNITNPDKCYDLIKESIHELQHYISIISPEEQEDPERIECGNGFEILQEGKNEAKQVKNFLEEVKVIAEENGSFTASFALLVRVFNFERLKLSTTDSNLNKLYCMCSTFIQKIRKCIRIIMEGFTPIEQPLEFSTPKLIQLFNRLQNFPEDSSAIIFVTRRITAQSLYYVFKHLCSNDTNFKNIKPDFIVGCNASVYSNTREPELKRKRNKETMESFNTKKTNVLFASDVIEEGIDIRHCNYVIKYDEPKTFCSYIQSMGRARHAESKFLIFASTEGKKPFTSKHREYKDAENKLTEELRHDKSVKRVGGTESEAKQKILLGTVPGCEPFYTGGPDSAVVSIGSAISLLNRYCGSLPSDSYTSLTVTFWKRIENDKTVVSLRLPMNSPLRSIIEGVPCNNIDTAKASAALEACKKLYYLNELNSKLLPVGNVIELDEKDAFPLWVEHDDDNCSESDTSKPGTKGRIRIYDREIPRCMCHCTPQPHCDTFIHLIRITPVYECPNTNRHKTFHHLLSSPNTFALLTSNKWPKVCEFPMFMNVGEVNIKIEENYVVQAFTPRELKEIFDFHCLLVTQVLPMKKKFLVKDLDNGKHSYYIAPCLDIKNGFVIDWKTIREHKSIPKPVPLTDQERANIAVTKDKYDCKIVIPWYRPVDMQLRYIVTHICEDMTPLSPFPSESYTSYSHYFYARYKEKVNPNQHLIEVRAISQKHNCLLPRVGKYRLGKRKKRDEEDLEEILIPELCCLLDFPAVYMLKVTLIPSVMHRLSQLFLAEQLRIKIASEVGLGKPFLPSGFVWERLKADETALNPEEEKPNQMKSTIEVSNMLTSNMESLNPSDCPWNKDDEPCDIDRNLLTADLISIRHYHNFARMKLDDKIEGKIGQGHSCMPANVPVPPLPFLKSVKNPVGPQLSELVQIFISNSGNDIINYERLETLGDSFLKFLTSIVLFSNFSDKDEGKLSYLKGKIVGNRNLFYCGRHIKLGSMIKAISFVPDDWDIPHYKLLDVIQNLMKELKISAEFLFSPAFDLSEEERNTSVLRDQTLNNILDLLSKAVGNESNSRGAIQILQQEAVSDKLVADSVEALIGVYLKTFGIEGGFKICQWLNICKWMLQDENDLQKILYHPTASAHLNRSINIDNLLIAPEILEGKLGYKFKDRSFLLQALSHSSYTQFATDCYQRLEFLGDAILDFLITCYIYKFDKLGPGELTDLRSALVNNVTFACLTVKYGFHKYLLTKAMVLSKVISKFADQQEKRHHKIGAEVFLLVNETEVKVGQMGDVPKILGDVFESLAGAVYLDSGKSLETVWEVFYKLMHNEIEEFSKDVPKNNIRLLYEKFPNPLPVFKKVENDDLTSPLMKLIITHNGEKKEFYGVGDNKSSAKMAAAKVALRHYHETVHTSSF